MAFPQTPIELLAEMQIGGVWTDITGDLYARAPLSIERGRQDEAARVDPARASFQLDNRQNKYSPRNPRSANYGRIGRNTPVRFSVPGTESYLAMTGLPTDIASTPDHASLDIVGDIDVRIEVTARWYDTEQQTLIGKWSQPTDGNRSWDLRLQSASCTWVWTPTGLSADALTAQFTLPPLPRRAALRLTMDVDNGAGGRTITLYWSTSLSGSWTTIGTVTVTGTTSIFNSTAPLEISPDQSSATATRYPLRGRVHRAELRSGIGGSVVAAPDMRALAPGTTSWADSAGRTWTLAGAAAISNREYRLHAEVSSWPPRWDPSGRDIYVPVEASGILRRLGQGRKALASTLRRRIPAVGAPVAYWPMEDGKDATQAYSPLPGVTPLVVSGFEFGADDSLFGSSALPKIDATASMRGTVPPYPATGQWLVSYMMHSPGAPASATTILEFTTTGTARRFVLTMDSDSVDLTGYDAAGSTVVSIVFSLLDFHGHWINLNLTAADQGGGNVRYELGWTVVDGTGYGGGTTIAGTAGIVTDISTTFGPLAADMRIGHLGVLPTSSTIAYVFGDNAWRGEEASRRIVRLGGEESVPIVSDYAPTPVDAQRPNTLLTLLNECADADLGVLYEARDRLGLVYKGRTTYHNQPVALTLDYSVAGHVAPPLEPVDDDQRVRNDRTVTRANGSSARAVDTTSPLSILPPPAGVGVYDDARTLNLRYDSQPEDIAGWLLHMGTWDEARYPTVHINLAAAPSLIPAVVQLDIGDRIQIINPPVWLPPGPIDLIVEGYTEVISHPTGWDIFLNCTPAGPWSAAFADDSVYGRADTDSSVLGADATSSATTLLVHTTQTADSSSPRWTQDPAEMPFDVRLGGEVVTATAITSLAEDTFARTVAAGGWGTASDGHTYTLTGGTGADRSVSGGLGLITATSAQTTLRMQTVAETCADAEIRCTVSVNAVATGASMVTSFAMRWSSASSCYRARVEWGVGGAIGLSAVVGSTLIDTSVSTSLTYTAGQQYEVRVRLIGHRILMRIWPTGTIEPTGIWQLDRTATTGLITSGQVGIGGGAFSGNTNATTEYRFANWVVASPQRMTVTRSVNGITKAQTAGTDVRLAQPAITSY
ncbi:hypothetical protein [Streptomyces sp. W1SF4]|uniref:hypothetical protein n=1 Tax=Streptomyces sp. W1SF4 TaxID=2305220 RepID=UPI000F6C3F2B|nr:hypothetical protein [Streptomyces sp. W1SF4]AZM91429.1 hypothetical protein D1J60_25575 [Streptomyces sp. W1SF4]